MPRVKGKPRRVIIQNSPEIFSWSDDETDGLRKGETEKNEVSLQETVQKSGSQQGSESGKTGAEKNPIPGPSSKDSNLKRNNDRAKKETQEKKSTSIDADSNKIRKKIEVKKHNKELKKCTTHGCKIYFVSDQKRSEHEQQEHQERKEFQCQFCHYSVEQKGDLNRHVLRKHSEKKIKCRQQKCGKMFASKADFRDHVRRYHKMAKCPKCCRKMSLKAMYDHNRYGRCPGKVVEV
ncbi:GDNF-inducible zinc finger protein 1-like [Cloeon dipterum]|uniref:GDNF-inducible zinc finger protein 1-like n=1 Tax=Cloeon dipterum TaxID=197152 RepID=UPI0032205D36